MGVFMNQNCSTNIIRRQTPWLIHYSEIGIDRILHELEKKGWVDSVDVYRTLRYHTTDKFNAEIIAAALNIIIK